MNGRKVFAHSPGGWILPCSWVSPHLNNPEEKITQNLFSEKLKIENVDNIEDILFSDEWLVFLDIIKNKDLEKLPSPCKKYCMDNRNHKVKIQIKHRIEN
jgi:hypothetical protein